MTKSDAVEAITQRLQVQGGTGDDPDIGHIIDMLDAETAVVSWTSGVRTSYPLADLSLA